MTVSFARIGNSLGYAQKGGSAGQLANLNGTTTASKASKVNDATYVEDPGSPFNLDAILVANGYTNAQVQNMTLNDMLFAVRLKAVFSNTAP